MTEQEKQLLLADLCARLPYHLLGIDAFGKLREMKVIYPTGTIIAQEVNGESCSACGFKPYLRPMSSMTREEEAYWYYHRHLIGDGIFSIGYDNPTYCISECFDWLNSHHFDYRGLIPMSLALEAPEGMYK